MILLLRRGLLVGFGLLSVITFFAASAAAVTIDPIATTGHDADIVFESGLTAGATGANSEIGSRQYFEDGATGPTDDGLPRTLPGFVSTLTGNTINFAFQPFEQNNVLKFSDANAATPKSLTLVTPAAYSNLAVVFAGGSLATATEVAGVAYTINYEGGGTQTGTLNAPDWGAVTTLPTGTERIFIADRTTASAATWPVSSDNNTTANRWALYVGEITTTSSANILSVSFGPITLNDADGLLNSGDDVVIYGLSGAVPVPEPACCLLGMLGAVIFGCTVLRRQK
jgi:hypothetical protein